MEAIRYKGKWYTIVAKPYEPERQKIQIAWFLVKNPNSSPEEAYRTWFKNEQENVKVLYPTFRKDEHSN